MQVRITRSRMAGEPPDVVVAPRLGDLGLLDFHRADEAIREGERAMTAALGNLAMLGIKAAAC
jgi:NTE family protein